MFVEIRYHDVINPSDTGPDGLSSWVFNPCTDCINRKDCSSFSTQLLRVNFQEIKKGNIPESLVCCITLVSCNWKLLYNSLGTTKNCMEAAMAHTWEV